MDGDLEALRKELKDLRTLHSRAKFREKLYDGIRRLAFFLLSVLLLFSAAYLVDSYYIPGDLIVSFGKHMPAWAYGMICAIMAVVSAGFHQGAENAQKTAQQIEQQIQQKQSQSDALEEKRQADEHDVRRIISQLHEVLLQPTPASMQSVRQLQVILLVLGHDVRVDGVFGAATKKVVVAVQAELGIEADGRVGKVTWDALLDKVLTSGKATELLERFRELGGADKGAAGA